MKDNLPIVGVTGRIPELDGLRGLAISMVLIWHFSGEIIDRSMSSWANRLFCVTMVGRTGVDLFFVLSGILITGIILDRKASPLVFLRSFLIRRGLRILPSYLLLVIVFFAIAWLAKLTPGFSTEIPLWRFLTFTQTWWMVAHNAWGPAGISVTWSVSVEEHYYLCFPLLILCLPRCFIPWLLVVLWLGSTMARGVGYFVFESNVFWGYVCPISRFDGFALGGLVAWALRHPMFADFFILHRRIFRNAALIALVIVLGLVGWFLQRGAAIHMFSWGHSVLAGAFGLVAIAVLTDLNADWSAWLRAKPLRELGRISYSVYLWHPVSLLLVFRLFGRRPLIGDVTGGLLALTALILTVLVCWKIFWPIEAKALEAGRRFAY